MTASAAVVRPGRGLILVEPGTRDRSVRRRIAVAWGLLMLNAIGYTGLLVHIPSVIGKAVTQGALPIAVIIALTVNRKVVIRPNVFLCLVSLLAFEAVMTALQPQFLSTVYRTFRFAEFVFALWLLSPWWGRRDLLLIRCHLACLGILLGSVILGIPASPGAAIGGGRLAGVLWSIPPTQVAHYAAVTVGLVVVLWLCGQMRGKVTLAIVVVTVPILLLTHTRTAVVGMVAALLIAGMSLIVARARARRLFAVCGVVATIAILTLSGFITTWAARGEGSHELADLTGRTLVWNQLLAFPRDRFQEIFGFGLSNGSFNGLSIDSTWFSTYQERGLSGVLLCAVILLFLLVSAYFQPRGVQRALALFLVTYCLVASFTEDGFTDATPYLLELTLAASLLVHSAAAERRASAAARPPDWELERQSRNGQLPEPVLAAD